MILLVVGLVAVIVVILIAVFLSIRLGRGDEHDDEPQIRPSTSTPRAGEARWREPDVRDTRQAARAAGRGMGDPRGRGREPAYSARGPARDRAHAGRDRDQNFAAAGPAAPRSAGSYPTTPPHARANPTTPRSASSDPATPPPYATGPRRPARRDPAEYGGSPARRRSPVPAATADRSRYDTGPSRRTAAGGVLPADHPSGDFPSADYGSGELPAVAARAAKPRPDSRRRAASAPAAGKSRSKPHRGRRDDDDDWPSGEWDQLSDEQYWAELSADKPLATMARPASSSKAAAARAPADEPAARDSRTARNAAPAASGRAQAEPEQGREPRGRRERPPQHEPVTELLPVRSRPQPAVPAARLAAEAPTAGHPVPVGQHPSLDTAPYTARDGGRHPSLDTGLPAARGGHAARDTGPLPARDGGRHPSLDAGPRRRRDPGLAALSGLASAPRPPVPGALDDDPLTSPSFSLKAVPATDSRSYSQARRSARDGAGNGSALVTGESLTSNGTGHTTRRESGGYPVADYASPGYAHPEPAAAGAAQWYAAPPAAPAPAPAYANPYSYPGAGTSAPAGYPGADPGHGSYLADPLRVYSPPQYQPQAPAYPDASGAPYQAHPALGMAAPSMGPAGHAPYPEAYPEHPYGSGHGQPEQGQYQDGYAGAGHTPSYENGYGGDPYAGGGFGTYQPQG